MPPPTFGLAPVNLDLDMAYYLVARGEYAWVGSGPILGWQLSHWWAPGKTRLIEPDDFRPHWFDQEYGEPEEGCFETAPGAHLIVSSDVIFNRKLQSSSFVLLFQSKAQEVVVKTQASLVCSLGGGVR